MAKDSIDFTKYFTDEWMFNRAGVDSKERSTSGGRIVAYNKITKEFENALNAMYDNGSAIITNTVKMFSELSIISGVDRVSDCITISFINTKEVFKSTNDGLMVYINLLFDRIITRMEDGTWPAEPDALHMIYATGERYLPDAMIGLIDDVGVQYNNKYCMYAIMLEYRTYDILRQYMKYFKSLLKSIMKCKQVTLLDKEKVLVISDTNKGTGPSIDRAHALGCAVMCYTLQILQLMEIKETMNQ